MNTHDNGLCEDRGYESICRVLISMINSDDAAEACELKNLKTGASVYMFDSVAIYIRINSRAARLETSCASAERYVGVCASIYKHRDVVCVDLACPVHDAPHVRALVNDVYNERYQSYLYGSSLACCNEFIACSDAMRCVKAGDPYYLKCLYRRNLASGRIFYGRNKNA